MTRFRLWSALAAALLAAAPAAADKVLTIANHTDEVSMMGQKTPAEDATYTYWFTDDAIRYDMGDSSILIRVDRKKMFVINHEEKTVAPIDLPIDFNQLVGPEMAPMMEQMMKMMAATTTITPTDRTGQFGGFACKYYKVDISMSMMQMAMNQCLTESLPIDYSKYKELLAAQSELAPNLDWMKELMKLQGFPVRSETTTTMMGKSFGSWQELKSVEDKAAPAGTYEPPAGYKEIRFDPMAQQSKDRR